VTRAMSSVPGLSLVLYGALLVIIIAFLPNGLVDLIKRMTHRYTGRTRQGDA